MTKAHNKYHVLTLSQIIITVWLLKGHKEEIMETWRDVWHNPAEPPKDAAPTENDAAALPTAA